mgnify:CR=1 FL=1
MKQSNNKPSEKKKKSSARKGGKGSGGNHQQMGIAEGGVSRNRNKDHSISGRRSRVRVCHRELVTEALAQDQFLLTDRQSLNPGNKNLFPWLSKISKAYENYRFHSVSVEYVTRSPTTTAGSILACHDPDAEDDTPTSIFAFSGYQNLVEAPLWKNFKMKITDKAMNNLGPDKYISESVASPGNNLNDSGSIYIVTEGGAPLPTETPSPVGRIWIEYDVELFNPTSEAIRVPSCNMQMTGYVADFGQLIPPQGPDQVDVYWVRELGLYQGVKFAQTGVYSLQVTHRITGGGTVTSMSAAAVHAETMDILPDATYGTGLATGYSAYMIKVNKPGAIVNLGIVTAGGVVSMKTIIQASAMSGNLFHVY